MVTGGLTRQRRPTSASGARAHVAERSGAIVDPAARLNTRLYGLALWVAAGAAGVALGLSSLPFIGGFFWIAWLLAGGRLVALSLNDAVRGPRCGGSLSMAALALAIAVSAAYWHVEIEAITLEALSRLVDGVAPRRSP